MMVEQGTDIKVCQNSVRSLFITTLLQQNSCVGFYSRPLAYLTNLTQGWKLARRKESRGPQDGGNQGVPPEFSQFPGNESREQEEVVVCSLLESWNETGGQIQR